MRTCACYVLVVCISFGILIQIYWLVVRAWAWIYDCIWQVLDVYRCACYCVCLFIHGFLIAACMGLLCTWFLFFILFMYIDTDIWLVVHAWAWIHDCTWKVLGVYRCVCPCVCLCFYGFLHDVPVVDWFSVFPFVYVCWYKWFIGCARLGVDIRLYMKGSRCL